MRIVIAAALASLALVGATEAKDMKACSADWKAQKTAKATGSQTRKQFMTTCLAAGTPTSLPSAPAAPAVAKSATSAMTPSRWGTPRRRQPRLLMLAAPCRPTRPQNATMGATARAPITAGHAHAMAASRNF